MSFYWHRARMVGDNHKFHFVWGTTIKKRSSLGEIKTKKISSKNCIQIIFYGHLWYLKGHFLLIISLLYSFYSSHPYKIFRIQPSSKTRLQFDYKKIKNKILNRGSFWINVTQIDFCGGVGKCLISAHFLTTFLN